MSKEVEDVAEMLPLEGVGDRLRLAREEQRLSLEHVSAETRIPIRHLEVIESGRFETLPARTYAIGFSRTYAKLVGLDESAIADEVRAELNEADIDRRATMDAMAPGDPAKLPSSGVVWAGAFAAILLIAGFTAFFSSMYGSAGMPSLIDQESDVAVVDAGTLPADDNLTPSPALAASENSTGQVVFTALEDGVWVRFFDASGQRLLEKQMVTGESFEIPSDAQEPRINTGRPDAFAITVGGREVPKLAEEPVTIGDAPVSAAALLARASNVRIAPIETVGPALN
ncbi:MAG: RodZ domain-containing protein [Pseudomonadota bacterium]